MREEDFISLQRAVAVEKDVKTQEWIDTTGRDVLPQNNRTLVHVDTVDEGWVGSKATWGRSGIYANGSIKAVIDSEEQSVVLLESEPTRPDRLPNQYFRTSAKLCIIGPKYLLNLDQYISTIPNLTTGQKQQKLNLLQRNLQKAHLIVGPPGTGKTYALGTMIAQYMVEHPRAKILALSTAHIAVDTLAIETYDAFVRITNGHPNRGAIIRAKKANDIRLYDERKRQNMLIWNESIQKVQEQLHALEKRCLQADDRRIQIQLQEQIEQCKQQRDDILKQCISQAQVTLTSVTHARESKIFDCSQFDLIVFDEAGMIGWATLMYWFTQFSAQFWFAGDPKQLPPIFSYNYWDKDIQPTSLQDQNTEARYAAYKHVQYWFGMSVYDVKQQPQTVLVEQKRMHPKIREYISTTMYNNSLRDSPLLPQRDPILKFGEVEGAILLKSYFDPDIRIQNGESTFRQYQRDIFDEGTGQFICACITETLKCACITETSQTNSILVVVRYKEQRKEILASIKKNIGTVPNVTVSTVHGCQGTEADLVIFDPVLIVPIHVTNARQEDKSRLLELDNNLVNVAISRAKHQVIVFGFNQYTYNNKYNNLKRYHEMCRHPMFSALMKKGKWIGNAISPECVKKLPKKKK